MDYFERLAAYAHEELGAPENFSVVEAGVAGGDPNSFPSDHTHIEIIGAVYEPVSRGPRKGDPNWRKPIAGTKRTYYIEREKAGEI